MRSHNGTKRFPIFRRHGGSPPGSLPLPAEDPENSKSPRGPSRGREAPLLPRRVIQYSMWRGPLKSTIFEPFCER